MRTKPTQDGGPGHRYLLPLILPVKKEDAHLISIFAFEATASSPLQSYFYPSPSDRASAIKSLENMLVATLSNPAFTLMKAVDPETGEVAAYAVWERVIRSGSSQGREEQGLQERKWGGGMKLHLMSLTSGNELGEKKSIGAFVGAETAKFMDSWAKDMNYIELQGLATSPRFQRRGYATALLKWGHERADAEGQVSFLLGSPVGRYLYASLGWKEVGQVVVDMMEWMEGAERGDLGWGVWKLYHMIRLPRAAARVGLLD